MALLSISSKVAAYNHSGTKSIAISSLRWAHEHLINIFLGQQGAKYSLPWPLQAEQVRVFSILRGTFVTEGAFWAYLSPWL